VKYLPKEMTKGELKDFCGKFIKSVSHARLYTEDEYNCGVVELTDRADIEILRQKIDGFRVKGGTDRLRVGEGDLSK